MALPQVFLLLLALDLGLFFLHQVPVSQRWPDNTVERTMAPSEAARVFAKNEAAAAEVCERKWTLNICSLAKSNGQMAATLLQNASIIYTIVL